MNNRSGTRPTLAIVLFLAMSLGFPAVGQESPETLSLAGDWSLALDPSDKGLKERWYNRTYSESILLPGSLQESGFGEPVSMATEWVSSSYAGYERFVALDKYAPYRTDDNFKFPYWLTPDTHYKGVAWFQREIVIPPEWQDKRVTLHLERVHWGSTVFVNDRKVGSNNSLATPHRYDLTESLEPGTHRLSIRVDNRVLLEIGRNSHSISDHTQSNWNGIVGEIALEATSPVFISEVKIAPDVPGRMAKTTVRVENHSGRPRAGTLRLQATSKNAAEPQQLPVVERFFSVDASGVVEVDYPMGDKMRLWDEFTPNLYRMRADLIFAGDDVHRNSYQTDFGMVDFRVDGQRFSVNGNQVFLRGTLESAIFPLTGYPSTSKKEWARIFDVIKQHGLNHVRFHSWCPPEAAFQAADEAGVYLQPEASVWPNQGATVGNGGPVDEFVISESKRILDEYGNHPSFVMFAHGNEPAGKNQETYLAEFIETLQDYDDRLVYTGGVGWPVLPENEYHVIPDPRIQQWEAGLKSRINSQPPSTDWDFGDVIEEYDRPVVAHEIGQWTVYPNFNEMSKYTGVLYPHNFEIFQDFLKKNHLLHQAEDFLMASGRLQVLAYKADIEAALRTPGQAGFQMLDLKDFPGQGTALVGVVDPFWDSKPYTSAREFRQFSSQTVPLARLEKHLWTDAETFTADLEVAHLGRSPMKAVPVEWRIINERNKVVASKQYAVDLPRGNNIAAGQAALELAAFTSPQKLTLEVRVGDLGWNHWDFWVYPQSGPEAEPSDILITDRLTPEVEKKLKAGARVLLKLDGRIRDDKGGDIAAGFSPIFWNTEWTGGQEPHTMGVLVAPEHPVFNRFPTEFHTNWQWWDILHGIQPMNLGDLSPELTPLVQMIDTWSEARKLGLMFEGRVGEGRLLVTSIDFDRDLDERLGTRQLYRSLMAYMNSEAFQPALPLEPDAVRGLYNQ
ncbi:glycoside hydrolase family 2 [Marinimicrobium agarilyticum]|uniref:glycoside hydrolase family 2 n=1 Tax=Marinimicrobium agarilyticum TaxID=306546 RepID=UPI0004139083|nr:glycoside hydrolase family 2 [Marinimicrobium agarilyticum]